MKGKSNSEMSPSEQQLEIDRKTFFRTANSIGVAAIATVLIILFSNFYVFGDLLDNPLITIWPPNLILTRTPSFALLPAEVGSRLLQITSTTGAVWLLWLSWNLFYDIKSKSVVFISGLFKVSLAGTLISLLISFFAFKISDGESLFTLNVLFGYQFIYIKAAFFIFGFYFFLRILLERVILYIKSGA